MGTIVSKVKKLEKLAMMLAICKNFTIIPLPLLQLQEAKKLFHCVLHVSGEAQEIKNAVIQSNIYELLWGNTNSDAKINLIL